MRDKCDMCGAEIIEDKCDCGIWTSAEENINNPIDMAIEEFHKMRRLTFTADAPHLGVGCIFFRGGYKECKALEEFFYNIISRPFYNE